jgi:dihydroorotase
MKKIIRNVTVVSQEYSGVCDVLINNRRIEKIYESDPTYRYLGYQRIDGTGLYLLPGVIDDQVHFREPGLTHKGDISTESRAAVAGGITSYFEQPNTGVQTITEETWLAKNEIAKEKSFANYGFNFGLTNSNAQLAIEMATKYKTSMPAIKIFMGSSTGDMLVDRKAVLEAVFCGSPIPICVHCEDEDTIKKNLEYYEGISDMWPDGKIPARFHSVIRSEEACYLSSSYAVALAKHFGTRLHVYHITTAKELSLFENVTPLKDKRITCEACIIHLNFCANDYQEFGFLIKQNPAVKNINDRDALLQALLDGTIDVIATDHAPHTLEEKNSGNYLTAPSGAPMVQHSLVSMLEFYHAGKMTLEQIVEKMCHNPATIFNVADRGFIKEGYFADMVLVDLNDPWTVDKSNILYKCGWSPFEGRTFKSKVVTTFVNGNVVYDKGEFRKHEAQQIAFNR